MVNTWSRSSSPARSANGFRACETCAAGQSSWCGSSGLRQATAGDVKAIGERIELSCGSRSGLAIGSISRTTIGVVIVLLAGGDKSTQAADIAKARAIAADLGVTQHGRNFQRV